MYVETRQLGLIPVAAIPIAASVGKNTIKFLSQLFGTKVVWGLKPEEFEQRHSNRKWFRNLWYKGYWNKDGAAELPRGMTVQDYYVGRFKGSPHISWGANYKVFLQRGIPGSTLRLSVIPRGMPWPDDIGRIPVDAILRVLPAGYGWDAQRLRAIAPRTAPARTGIAPTVAAAAIPAAGLPELVRSPVVLIGLGLVGFFVMQTIMRSGR